MLVIGVFKQSIELEQALAELEQNMIPREHILVTFMEKKFRDQEHTPHPFEVGVSCGTGGAVIGASVGFGLTLGPIIWGLSGAIIGYSVGIGIYFWVRKRKKSSPVLQEVTVIIQCTDQQFLPVQELLWKYEALSVGYHRA